MSTEDMTETPRDIFKDELLGRCALHQFEFHNALRRTIEDRAAAGLEALCILWFDTHDDEMYLPKELAQTIDLFWGLTHSDPPQTLLDALHLNIS